MERRDFLKNAGLVVACLASHNLFAAPHAITEDGRRLRRASGNS